MAGRKGSIDCLAQILEPVRSTYSLDFTGFRNFCTTHHSSSVAVKEILPRERGGAIKEIFSTPQYDLCYLEFDPNT